mmetsp:Transcript_6721/g.5884  ORF Transcript_6721/g.5884 Transcript_6721/m.5884 type:complete len:129 (+) Transcript_6721:666-1052(+)
MARSKLLPVLLARTNPWVPSDLFTPSLTLRQVQGRGITSVLQKAWKRRSGYWSWIRGSSGLSPSFYVTTVPTTTAPKSLRAPPSCMCYPYRPSHAELFEESTDDTKMRTESRALLVKRDLKEGDKILL